MEVGGRKKRVYKRKQKKLIAEMPVHAKTGKQKTRTCQFLGSHYIHILRGMIYVDMK